MRAIRRAAAGAATGVILAAAVGALPAARAASPGPPVTPAAPNALVDQDNNPIAAHNSESMAENPVRPANIVVVDRVDRPDYTAGVHVSEDGARTWQDSSLVLPTGNKGKLFAPTAAFNGQGTLYVLFVTLSGPGNSPDGLWIERSGDGGLTFDQPEKVAGANTFQTDLAVDRKSGRLFATWVQSTPVATMCNLCFAATGLPIVVSYSDDAGRTWSPPAQVSDPGRARVGAPTLAVGPHSNPAVLYYDYNSDRSDWENLPGPYDGKFALVLARSRDHGLTFGPGRVVDADIVPAHRFLVYLPETPAFAIGANGRMVAAWPDARFGEPDILLRTSGDAGATWRAPVKVNPDPAGDGVAKDLPAAGVASNGRIDVLYYDAILDHRGTTTDLFLSSSFDGGRTFPETQRVSSQSSVRQVGPSVSPYDSLADFGSRIGLISLPAQAVAAWTDTRLGTVDSGRQDVFLAVVPVPVSSGPSGLGAVFAVGGALAGLVGIGLLVGTRRRRGDPKPSPRPGAPFETPPPLPPLVPTPGQV